MTLKNPEFITSLTGAGSFAGDGLPKVVVAGKSNVGKSSLINCLCNRNKLARVSQTPGKTRLINLFNIGGEFILCDLPGYGFARVPESERRSWGRMVEGFLEQASDIRLILHLLDIRHPPTKEDVQMAGWLQHYQTPFVAVLTKADKLSRAQRQKMLPVISRTVGAQPWEMIPFSSHDKTGRDELISRIHQAVRGQEDGAEQEEQP